MVTEAYKELERKDVQNNETVKATKDKLKKAAEKMTTDEKQVEVR